MSEPRYFARSASDRTDDWPLWFVADRRKSGLNVTLSLIEKAFGRHVVGMPFLPREHAETLAEISNNDQAATATRPSSAGDETAVRTEQ